MLLSRYRLWLRSALRLLRTPLVRILMLVVVLLNLLQVWHIHRILASEQSPSERLALSAPSRPSRKVPAHSQRVYVAAIHWNTGTVLRSHWNDAVVALADRLGPKNMYVSVHESGSWDHTKEALKELDAALAARGVARTVNLSEVTHKDEIDGEPTGEGWVDTSRGRKELRRIPYLSRLRNESLKKLSELEEEGIMFDKILFLNDIVFTTDDILELLDTNHGQYAAACALDYKHTPAFYDTFALRDSKGHEPLMQTWPYFRSRLSRKAMLANVAVPVSSCWNGVVAMPASPFVGDPPLRFRGISDSLATYHLEGSECCLVHADNQLSGEFGVYVNPKVRVGYNKEAYEAVHAPAGHSWVSLWGVLRGLWLNRVLRWCELLSVDRWKVFKRLDMWRKEGSVVGEKRFEPGGFCLIDEMQVLVANGWAHV